MKMKILKKLYPIIKKIVGKNVFSRKASYLSENANCNLVHLNLYKNEIQQRFNLLLIIIFCIIIQGIFIKIPFFIYIFYYYVFLYVFYVLKIYVISNKYFDVIFSESNIIIRLFIPIIIYLFFDFNTIIICLVKFIIIIAIRIYLIDKLSYSSIIYIFIFCLCSNFIYPIISVCMFELFIFRMNSSSNVNNNSNFIN